MRVHSVRESTMTPCRVTSRRTHLKEVPIEVGTQSWLALTISLTALLLNLSFNKRVEYFTEHYLAGRNSALSQVYIQLMLFKLLSYPEQWRNSTEQFQEPVLIIYSISELSAMTLITLTRERLKQQSTDKDEEIIRWRLSLSEL